VGTDGSYQHDAGMERTKREQTAEGKPSLKGNCGGAERLENASDGERNAGFRVHFTLPYADVANYPFTGAASFNRPHRIRLDVNGASLAFRDSDDMSALPE